MTTEKDPYGTHQSEPGAKLDNGKPRPALVLGAFSRALEEVVEVGTFGAEKYSENGWLEVPNAEFRYMDAALRHLLKDMRGITIDDDSDCLHLAQVAWNVLAVLELRMRNEDDKK